jgi:hypothetical protein
MIVTVFWRDKKTKFVFLSRQKNQTLNLSIFFEETKIEI